MRYIFLLKLLNIKKFKYSTNFDPATLLTFVSFWTPPAFIKWFNLIDDAIMNNWYDMVVNEKQEWFGSRARWKRSRGTESYLYFPLRQVLLRMWRMRSSIQTVSRVHFYTFSALSPTWQSLWRMLKVILIIWVVLIAYKRIRYLFQFLSEIWFSWKVFNFHKVEQTASKLKL